MSIKSTSVSYSQTTKMVLVGIFVLAVTISPLLLFKQQASAAACTVPSTDYGQATMSASVPGAATYRVWTRMYVPDATNNSYLLEIDGNTCASVGGTGVASGSWVWVSHQNSSLASKIDVALASGAHSLKLIGNKPGVKIDRIVFTSDLTCVPTGFGDNCNTPNDATAPSVKVTSPAAGASVSGSTVSLTATATDDVAVSRVEFYVDGVLTSTDTSSPYAATWDSSKVANGAHQVSARGYDTSGNASSDSIQVTVSNGDTIAPTVPTGVLAQASAYNKVRVTWSASNDNSGIAGYRVFRNGVPIATLGAVTSYDDATVSASTAYTYKVEAFDAAGNKSALSTGSTVTTPGAPIGDTQAPSQPTGLSASAVSQTQINLKWIASTDNVGVAQYQIFRKVGTNNQQVGTSATTSYGDTGLTAGTAYSYQVSAIDAAGNVSAVSASISATTMPAQTPAEHGHALTGVVTNRSGTLLSGVKINVSNGDGTTQIVQTNSVGRYAIYDLHDGTYTLSVQKRRYATTQLTVVINGADQVKNITLSRR